MRIVILVLCAAALMAGCAPSQGRKAVVLDREGRRDSVMDETTEEIIKTLFDDGAKLEREDPETALKTYREIIEIAPVWEAYYNSAVIYAKLEELKGAMDALYTALDYGGPPVKIYNTLAGIYLAMGENKKAVDAAETSLSYEESSSAFMSLANAYHAAGNLKRAIKYYKKAERLDSESQLLHYNLAVLWYDMGDYNEALREISKIVSAEGVDVRSVLTCRAQIHMRLGEYEKALKDFAELANKYPYDPSPYKNMGIIHELYLDDMDSALKSYTTYLERTARGAEDIKLWIQIVKSRMKRGGK